MRLLLDTHSFLWFVDDNPRLSMAARNLIKDAGNDVFLSVVSVWEIAIKVGAGKLDLGQPIQRRIPQELRNNSMGLLNVTVDHAAVVAVLPLHHRDPFDRMLVAQAQVEQMPIVSGDAALDAYGITRLW
jgi:PIN domain nuclease of toxin-antitoxin system